MKSIEALTLAIARAGGDMCMPNAINFLVGEENAWGGGHAPELPSIPNVFLGCMDLSEAGMEAILAIQAACNVEYPKIDIAPCSPIVYLVDGARCWDMPIAKSLKAYKRPHWVPLLVKVL